MNVPGENYKGVYSANEYLTRVNLMGAWQEASDTPVLHGQRVVVVGGGNVAMDAVRTLEAARRGRGDHRLPALARRAARPARRRSTTRSRRASGSSSSSRPLEVLGDEQRWVTGLRCQRMELGEPDASGRRRPVPVPGSEFEIACDMVVVAIGTRSQPAPDRHRPGAQRQRVGLHRDRRVRDDLHARRLRRRRHRPRRGDGHPRDGRRQALRGVDRRLPPRRVAARPPEAPASEELDEKAAARRRASMASEASEASVTAAG